MASNHIPAYAVNPSAAAHRAAYQLILGFRSLRQSSKRNIYATNIRFAPTVILVDVGPNTFPLVLPEPTEFKPYLGSLASFSRLLTLATGAPQATSWSLFPKLSESLANSAATLELSKAGSFVSSSAFTEYLFSNRYFKRSPVPMHTGIPVPYLEHVLILKAVPTPEDFTPIIDLNYRHLHAMEKDVMAYPVDFVANPCDWGVLSLQIALMQAILNHPDRIFEDGRKPQYLTNTIQEESGSVKKKKSFSKLSLRLKKKELKELAAVSCMGSHERDEDPEDEKRRQVEWYNLLRKILGMTVFPPSSAPKPKESNDEEEATMKHDRSVPELSVLQAFSSDEEERDDIFLADNIKASSKRCSRVIQSLRRVSSDGSLRVLNSAVFPSSPQTRSDLLPHTPDSHTEDLDNLDYPDLEIAC